MKIWSKKLTFHFLNIGMEFVIKLSWACWDNYCGFKKKKKKYSSNLLEWNWFLKNSSQHFN